MSWDSVVKRLNNRGQNGHLGHLMNILTISKVNIRFFVLISSPRPVTQPKKRKREASFQREGPRGKVEGKREKRKHL